MPVKSEKIANRNDKVTVQYPDGKVLKDVKYKKVEEDIKAGRCIVIEEWNEGDKDTFSNDET